MAVGWKKATGWYPPLPLPSSHHEAKTMIHGRGGSQKAAGQLLGETSPGMGCPSDGYETDRLEIGWCQIFGGPNYPPPPSHYEIGWKGRGRCLRGPRGPRGRAGLLHCEPFVVLVRQLLGAQVQHVCGGHTKKTDGISHSLMMRYRRRFVVKSTKKN